MFKTWTQSAVGLLMFELALVASVTAFAQSDSDAQELAPPNASAFEEAPVLVRRLPAVINQPPIAIDGLEKLDSGDGELIERLPPAINKLPLPVAPAGNDEAPTGRDPAHGWSPSDIPEKKIGDLPPRKEQPTKFREPELHLLDDEPATTFEGDMSYGSVPPPFTPPVQVPAAPEPIDEFLPQTYHPPIDPQAGSIPRAYVPPKVVESSQVAQWAPWWDEPLGRVSLLSAPTVPVNLQELMNLSLRNSPVVQVARNAMSCGDCGKSKSRVDSMLYSVAQGYWETYRLRGIVIVRERLYQDGLVVCRQLRTLVGKDNELTILAISSARERLAELAAAHEALRKAQNKLTSVVSIPNWEQEHELLPMDSPFCRPYQIDEAAELRNALSRRAEMQGMMNSIQAASYRPSHRSMASPIQVHSYNSPELEEISDRIKLEVKNSIVRIAGSYETMRRFSNAAQSSAREVAALETRCSSCTGSDQDLPLFFRDLLDAQSRLAEVEQRFITAQANYSAAILELRRANGTIIDRCTFHRGGPVRGPGISNPRTVNAVWHEAPQPNVGPLEPSATIFQSPQQPLQDNSGYNGYRRGRENDRQDNRDSQWQTPDSEWDSKDWESKGQGWTPPERPSGNFGPTHDHDLPRGEFPMPTGEELVPGRANPDASFPGLGPAHGGASIELAPPTNEAFQAEPHDVSPGNVIPSPVPRSPQPGDIEPYDFDDFGGESSLTPPSSGSQFRSPLNNLRNRQMPNGELPMPQGEDLIQSASPSQLWQPNAQPPALRESRRRVYRPTRGY